MTTIKPPDGRSSSETLGSPATGANGADRTSGSFRDSLGPDAPAPSAQVSGSSPLSQTGGTQRTDEPGALAAAVRAGTMTPDQAVDRLVERAVAGVSVS